MNKSTQQQSSVKKFCKVELFGANGSNTIIGNNAVLFSKLVTSDGADTWILLHQN